jgi:hypothetical protein
MASFNRVVPNSEFGSREESRGRFDFAGDESA